MALNEDLLSTPFASTLRPGEGVEEPVEMEAEEAVEYSDEELLVELLQAAGVADEADAAFGRPRERVVVRRV